MVSMSALAQISGTGLVTASIDKADAEPTTWPVEATFENNVLKVTNFANTNYPLSFNVNVTTGEAVTLTGQIGYQEDFTFSDGEVYDTREYYYGNKDKKELFFSATLFNTDAGYTVLEVDGQWDLVTQLFPGFYVVANNGSFYNTRVIFDFGIPGLPGGAVNDNPGGGPGVDEGDPHVLAGLWEFTFRQYADSDYPSTRTEQFNATAKGNVITFTWTASASLIKCGNMTGTFNPADNTITFSSEKIPGGTMGSYDLMFSGITYDPIEEVVIPTNVVAQYSNETMSLEFPQMEGFMWEAYKNGEPYSILDIFVVRSARQLTGGDVETGIEALENENVTPRYFDLQGREISNPTRGSICIRVTGDKVEKIIVR